MNNPPLRRMRTSLVNRRRLAEIQEREVCEKYLKMHIGDFVTQSLIILYFTICYFLPSIFGGSRDAECTMRTDLAIAMFGWVLCGLQASLDFLFISSYLCKKAGGCSSTVLKEHVEKMVGVTQFSILFLNSVGWATWFYWTQVLWTDISTGDCLSGYNLFDFINWLLLLIITIWPALLIAFGCLCCICCAPCLYKTAHEYFSQQRDAQRERNGVIDAIVQRRYNKDDFKE